MGFYKVEYGLNSYTNAYPNPNPKEKIYLKICQKRLMQVSIIFKPIDGFYKVAYGLKSGFFWQIIAPR
jgi:hypothetical protein